MISIPFLKKFSAFNPQDSIGIDWGMKGFKWVQLESPRPGIHRLKYLDYLELPQEEDRMMATLKDYCKENGFIGKPAAVSIQDETLHIRRLELPRMPEEDLKEAVRWQMRDIAEGSLDDYIVRHTILEEIPGPDMVRLVLTGYAIKKSAIHHHLQLLERAGLKPFFIEPTPVATATALERVSPSSEGEWQGCVDIGCKKSYFLAIGNGKLHLVRPLAGVQAEQIDVLGENYATKLAMEIQHAIDALSITYHIERLEKIFLAGGGASTPNLSTSLSKNLGIAVEILNPLQGLEQTVAFPLAMEKPHLFGAALSLALLKP
ncbi:MAG: pilus assembly protein PilM [Deltaproteobacteria bacterium]|nr:pilus assembly protein PilM [Deltaproteobacteria bacterium]